ncbi:MAG TPA: hypothetical protein VJC16_02750 [Candidatus Nanoarchaeia archaeon]|nr:hypothetical protein [Candidatus Nanoarchaeia archaeon]
MRLLPTIVFIVLVLLVIGLYYFPNPTKDAMQVTGSVIKDVGEKGLEKVKESGPVRNITAQIQEKVDEARQD